MLYQPGHCLLHVLDYPVLLVSYHIEIYWNRPEDDSKRYYLLALTITLFPSCFAPSGELSGQGAELLIRFHTSTRERPQYTIRTHGDCDMIIALLGPDNYTNVIK